MKKFLNPEGMPKPAGLYSQVVKASGTTNLYIAGQVARDSRGNIVGKGDFEAQAVQVYENISKALGSEGATFGDIVKITTYVTDMRYRGDLKKVTQKYFETTLPASTLVEVTHLADPDYLIEVEAVAVLD